MVKIEAALEILYCLMTVDNEIHETELKEILRFLLKAGFEVAENHLKTRDQEYEGLILKMGTLSALSRDALQQKYTQARDYLQTHLTADQKQRIMDYAVDMIVADGQVRPEEKELLQDLSLAWQVPMRDL